MSLEFDVLEKNVLTFCTCCRRFCLKIIFEILDRRHRAYTCSLMQRCLGLRERKSMLLYENTKKVIEVKAFGLHS